MGHSCPTGLRDAKSTGPRRILGEASLHELDDAVVDRLAVLPFETEAGADATTRWTDDRSK